MTSLAALAFAALYLIVVAALFALAFYVAYYLGGK